MDKQVSFKVEVNMPKNVYRKLMNEAKQLTFNRDEMVNAMAIVGFKYWYMEKVAKSKAPL